MDFKSLKAGELSPKKMKERNTQTETDLNYRS